MCCDKTIEKIVYHRPDDVLKGDAFIDFLKIFL